MWTRFMDMGSGGGRKEPYSHILIEAPEQEAIAVFYARFGHNPGRVSCTCCGEDYSVMGSEALEQATGFDRGCRWVAPRPKIVDGKADWTESNGRGVYIEAGEDPPEGFTYESPASSFRQYMTLKEYEAQENVLIVRASEIKDEERTTEVPEQGFVWVE